MHKAFDGAPPRYCTRHLDSSQKCDVGLGSKMDLSDSSGSKPPSKRQNIQIDVLVGEEEKERDNAMASFFKGSEMRSTMKHLADTITGPAFQFLPKDVQDDMIAKYTALNRESLL